MEFFFFWVLLLLILVALAAWPSWGYTRDRWPYRYGDSYRYYPSAAAAAAALLILVLFWLGFLAIAWPWAATSVVVE
jgi:hypothetical protein